MGSGDSFLTGLLFYFEEKVDVAVVALFSSAGEGLGARGKSRDIR